MSAAESVVSSPTRLVVLPHGIEPSSSPYDGTVQQDSEHSGDTYDRAVLAADYTRDNPEVSSVIFVSRETFMVPRRKRCSGAEADAGAEVAIRRGLPTEKVLRLNRSRTTVGGFLEAWKILRGLRADPHEALGVVMDEEHQERALWLGGLVLPNTPLIPILVDQSPREDNQAYPRDVDMATKLYRIAMWGVRPGNIRSIAVRDWLMQKALAPVVFAQGVKEDLAEAAQKRNARKQSGGMTA